MLTYKKSTTLSTYQDIKMGCTWRIFEGCRQCNSISVCFPIMETHQKNFNGCILMQCLAAEWCFLNYFTWNTVHTRSKSYVALTETVHNFWCVQEQQTKTLFKLSSVSGKRWWMQTARLGVACTWLSIFAWHLQLGLTLSHLFRRGRHSPPPPPPHTHTYSHTRTHAHIHTHTHTHNTRTHRSLCPFLYPLRKEGKIMEEGKGIHLITKQGVS